ncbi:MAG: InlB B-repeat-containing protein [Treponema sp.]|jgi:hypothetical protein|nr:InlB B-repeat-containing protein [Treponema sp.]
MKKFLVKGCGVLLSAMLVFSFAACSSGDDSPSNDGAALKSVRARADGVDYTVTLGSAITARDWDEYFDKEEIETGNIGEVDFNNALSTEVTFTVSASSKAAVTYAVVKDSDLPSRDNFNPMSTPSPLLEGNDTVYFRVQSGNGSKINYYCIDVKNMGETESNNIRIVDLKIGGSDAEAVSPTASVGKPDVNAADLLKPYVMPSKYMTGSVQLLLKKVENGQSISWAVKTAADSSAPSSFTPITTTAGAGEEISAALTTGGLKNEDKVYVKVVAADGTTTRYYGFKIDAGNIAEINKLELGDGTEFEEVVNKGTPGTSLEDNRLRAVTYDFQGVPPNPFTIKVDAKDSGAVAWAVGTRTSGNPTDFTNATDGTFTSALTDTSVIYIRITSANGKTAFYKINILLKTSATVYYGQPVIYSGTGGSAPTQIDPLWGDDSTGWVFNINRVNLNEMNPAYKFTHTVDGDYDDTGFGHTEGKAKAFWDDYGLYVYAQMTFHDYYASAGASATARTTTLAEAGPADDPTSNSNAHMFDGLEIFTNERKQAHPTGGYGIQYRTAPAAFTVDTNSRISGTGTSGAQEAINLYYKSENYYSWVRKDVAGKEIGYSVMAYIPWMFKGDSEANQVFGNDGKITGTTDTSGPVIGVEFQLNTSTSGGSRDAILTWNGIMGQAYTDGVKNYGNVTLAGGSNMSSRGEKDPAQITVTLDLNGGTGSFPSTISVNYLMPLGASFPGAPVKDGYLFNGWYDAEGVRYTANTVITKPVTLKADLINEATEVKFNLQKWITAHPEFDLTGKTQAEIDAVLNDGEAVKVKASASSSSAEQPLYLNGSVAALPAGQNYAYIDNSSLILMINGSGQGLRINVSDSGLDLNLPGRKYDILYEGSIVKDNKNASAADLRVETYTSASAQIYSCPITHVEGDTFSFGCAIPATPDVVAMRLSAGSAAAGMVFRLTNIMIIDRGAR